MTPSRFECQIHGWNGCCCVCDRQVQINSHPGNKDSLAKGPISETIGYGCTMGDVFEPAITRKWMIFFEWEHGLCEEFEARDDIKDHLMTLRTLKYNRRDTDEQR